jgi:uncharacterized membrane protein YcaP (DUF421 family)
MELFNDMFGVGLEPKEFNYLQLTLRAIVIFIGALAMVRLGAKRFLGRKTAFDIILMFILGSMLSRAINGPAPLLPTLVAGFALIMIHRWMAMLAFRFQSFGRIVKGRDDVVISNGQVQKEAMRKHHLTDRDLLEDLRLRSIADVSEVKEARLERSGDLSVLPKRS